MFNTNPRGLAAVKATGEYLRTKDGGDPFDLIARKIGDLADTTVKRLDALETKANENSESVACIEQKITRGYNGGGGSAIAETWGQEFIETKGDAIRALSESNRGLISLNVKALTGGATSAGALALPARDATAMLPQRRLTVRDLLAVVQVGTGTVEYAQQTTRTIAAATVAEGALKPQSDLAWTLRTASTRVIAHWVKASRQVLDDVPMLRDLIDSELRYGLAFAEENQLLNGDGLGQNLSGLITNATAFVDPLALPSPTMLDKIGAAILQTALADFQPDGIIMSPADWIRMRLLKDAGGVYIIGDPQTATAPRVFGLPVVTTQAIAVDKFLVGSFASAATLYDRQQPRVEVGYEHDDFTKNLVTILAEERLALAVRWPNAITSGDFGFVA